jgi:hypothetical protein
VPLRYLLAFIPVVAPVRHFFESAVNDRAEIDAIERARTRAIHLHVTLFDFERILNFMTRQDLVNWAKKKRSLPRDKGASSTPNVA